MTASGLSAGDTKRGDIFLHLTYPMRMSATYLPTCDYDCLNYENNTNISYYDCLTHAFEGAPVLRITDSSTVMFFCMTNM